MHGINRVQIDPDSVIAQVRHEAAVVAESPYRGNAWQAEYEALDRVIAACDELQAALYSWRSMEHVEQDYPVSR